MGRNSSAYFRALSEGRDELLPAEWVSEYLGIEFSKVTTMEGLLLLPIMESSGSDGLWFSPLSSPSFGLQKEKAFVLLIYWTDICWVPTLAARSLLLRAMGGGTAAGRVLPGGVQAEHGRQKHIQALLQSKKSKPSGAGQNPPGSRARGGISDKVTRTSLDSEMRFEPEDGGLTGSSWSNPSSVHPLRLWVLWTWWHPKVDAYAPPSVPAGGAKCHLSPTSRYFLWQESNRQFTFYIL